MSDNALDNAFSVIAKFLAEQPADTFKWWLAIGWKDECITQRLLAYITEENNRIEDLNAKRKAEDEFIKNFEV